MCDVGMKEAIEKLAKAIEGNNIRVQTPKIETISPWLNTGGILKVKDIPMKEELENAAKLALKDSEGIQTINFYDVPKVAVSSDGIKVKHEHGSITFNNEGLSFDFGVALEYIKKGLKVCRKGWNGKGMYVKLEKGGDYEFSEINPFFVIKNTSNSFNTWVPSVSDLLATDWTIYIGE